MGRFNDNELLLIEQYISGELKGDALLQFEEKITQNPGLEKEVHLRKSITEGIAGYGALRERIKNLDQAVKEEQTKVVTIKKRRPLALAATLVFIILGAIIYFSFFGNNDIRLEPIMAEISADSKYIPKIRSSRGNNVADIEREFRNSYENGNYTYCIGVCDNLQNDSLLNELSIYCGFSNEILEQYKKAINIYDNIIQKDDKYVTEALFHKAFCHMKLKEKDASIAALNLVMQSKEDSPFQEKAKGILDDLKELDSGEWE